MSETIIRGAVMTGFSSTTLDGGGKQVEINIHAPWDQPFLKEKQINTPPDCYGAAPLPNLRLNGVNFILTPNEDALKGYEIDVTCTLISGFKYVPRLDREGEIRSRELHFVIQSSQTGVCSVLENYQEKVGKGAPGALKLTINEQAVLPLAEGGETPAPEGEGEKPRRRGRKRGQQTEESQPELTEQPGEEEEAPSPDDPQELQ